MDTRPCSSFQSLPGAFDIRTAGTGKSNDDGAANDAGNSPYRFKITVGGNGESGLDDINAETVQLMRQAQLFLVIHAATGRLLPVAQGGIENDDANRLLRRHGFLPQWIATCGTYPARISYERMALKQNL